MRAVLSRPAKVTAAFILAAFAATVAVNWPGHLSYDSLSQLHDGRIGLYNTWHPPVMAWLLGLCDWLLRGAALYLVLSSVLFFGALLSLVWLRPRASWAGLAAAAILAVLPEAVLYQGLVWKDVLFANAAVASFVALAHAAAQWQHRRLRCVLVAVTVLFAVLAALVRQNGFVIPVTAALALLAIGHAAGARWPENLARVAAFSGVALVAIAGATYLLDLRTSGISGSVIQLRALQVYDLSGMVARDPALPLAMLDAQDWRLATALRSRSTVLYTPIRIDPEFSDRAFQHALAGARPDVVSAQWRAAIASAPILYLRTRLAAFEQITLTPNILACRPVFTGIDGPPDLLQKLAMQWRQDTRDVAIRNYAMAFAGTPAFSHLTYAMIAVLCLWFLLRRRLPEDIAMAAMLIAAALFTASFFAISIACDYRYLYVLDLSALTAAFYLALGVSSLSPAARRSPDAAHPPSSRSSESR